MSVFSEMTLPEMYERFLVEPLFRPFAEELLNRTHPMPADSVLDVACGTGIVARLARRRLGPQARIVGVDAAPPMLAIARQADATIDWREGSAMTLPVSLAPGGRVAVATWQSIADIPFAGELHQIAERHLGPMIDVRHSFGDGAALARLLAEEGFTDVHVETVSGVVRGIDAPTYGRLNAMAMVGMSPNAKTFSENERAQITDRIAADSLEVTAKYTSNGVLQFTLSTNLATAFR
jgi:SAM-dependent methyltransferase